MYFFSFPPFSSSCAHLSSLHISYVFLCFYCVCDFMLVCTLGAGFEPGRNVRTDALPIELVRIDGGQWLNSCIEAAPLPWLITCEVLPVDRWLQF